MLSKLLKYEYRATAKILLPLYLGVLFVIMLNVLVFRIGTLYPVLGSGTPYTVIQVLLTFLCGLGLLAVLAVSFFMGIQRFYSLLGTRGYLMFSLPVTTNQLIASKLICAVSWMTASFLLCNILFRMIGLPTEGSDLVIAPMGETPPLFVSLCLAVLSMFCCAFLFFYFCIAIGGQWPQNRLLATVVCYFVISFLLQLLLIVGMMVLGTIIYFSGIEAFGNATQAIASAVTSYQLISIILLCMFLFFAVGSVILWLLIRHFLTRKLNLA